MLEFNPETPYLNVKRLIDEFERVNCGGEVPTDEHARRLRVAPSLAFAVLVMCDRLQEVVRAELQASSSRVSDASVSHAKASGVGLRVVPS